jgi:hypothetical protein
MIPSLETPTLHILYVLSWSALRPQIMSYATEWRVKHTAEKAMINAMMDVETHGQVVSATTVC